MEKEIHSQISWENTLCYISSWSVIMHISIVKVLSPDVNKFYFIHCLILRWAYGMLLKKFKLWSNTHNSYHLNHLKIYSSLVWRRKWQPTLVLAWKIPWTEECGRLQSMGSQRDGHDWATGLNWTEVFIEWDSLASWGPPQGVDWTWWDSLISTEYQSLNTIEPMTGNIYNSHWATAPGN